MNIKYLWFCRYRHIVYSKKKFSPGIKKEDASQDYTGLQISNKILNYIYIVFGSL